MDEQNRPKPRQKKIVEGKGLGKQGEAVSSGPVNNMGNYEDRKEQQSQQQKPSAPSAGRESSTGMPGQGRPQNTQAQFPFGRQNQSHGQNPFGTGSQHSRPQSGGQFPFGQQNRPQQSQNPFGQNNTQQSRPQSNSGRTYGTASRPQGGAQQTPRDHSQTTRTGSSGTGNSGQGSGMGKIILAILAGLLIYFLLSRTGILDSLFGRTEDLSGNSNQGYNYQSTTQSNSNNEVSTNNQTGTASTLSEQYSGNSGISIIESLLGGNSGTDMIGSLTGDSGSDDSLTSLLGSGISGNDLISQLFGSGYVTDSYESGSDSNQYFTASQDDNDQTLDEAEPAQARSRYTTIKGGGKDTVTVLVYMCGADLESQSGMATSDLKEMISANLSDKINLIVFTGGCNRWRNNVIQRQNQIYQVKDGKLYLLEENMGSASMTEASTLAEFIKYGKKNFDANRMCLIFWDHGGGSVSGYGYDERYGKGQTMTLAGINNALKSGGIKFDFIGFDTCLMATVENGIMLSQYADYMIASEETEPGVGWYYTNWLNQLSKNTSTPTVQIGKKIVDDFVEVCNQKCRGQATTLSVVDLAELEVTIPTELKNFSIDTNELIQNNEYKKVSNARSKTREFAQSSRIDQIDLIHFARNMGNSEGKKLAAALESAIKYNRTGGGISNAYGLSIYFPYQRTGQVNKMVSTYKEIGMDEEYTRCIQEFASLEVSGQVSSGTSIQNYGTQTTAMPGLMDSLLGGGTSGYYSTSGSSYSSDGLESLLGGLFSGGSGSGGSTGSILDLFMGRSMTAEKAAAYILENHFEPDSLVWADGKITLSQEQWDQVESVKKNVFYDDGKGFVDLGTVGGGEIEYDGDSVVYGFDGYWLSLNGQTVAYYFLNSVIDGDNYCDSGYVPVLLNGERANLMINFDSENPDGYIAGVQMIYDEEADMTQGKTMIQLQKGDQIQAIFDYFTYDGNYVATYKYGNPIVLDDKLEIAYSEPGEKDKCKVTYCFTDYYQQRYWAPSI